MINKITYLNETASQTAGPYVHIGLAPKDAGFDIFERNFTNILVGPNTKGERITLEGKVIQGTQVDLEFSKPRLSRLEGANRSRYRTKISMPICAREDFACHPHSSLACLRKFNCARW